jgi:aspartyl-tRNA(Asn)/glutamyl-tRNA(Gln) amidotransferase subunit C
MSLTYDDVRHIAKLSRLELSEEEVALYADQLTSILGYVDMLREVDTAGVEATAQATGLSNVLRPDELRTEPLAEPDALLATSPLPITDHQIETPSAHG